MSVATKTISFEDVCENIFSYLPPMKYSKDSVYYPINFGYGDEKALNLFLVSRDESDIYPLVWLLYPYKEKHTNTKLEIDKVDFILAVDTNSSMQNKERMQETFGKILMPLLFNVREAFKKANIVNINNEYEVIKYPNYSESDVAQKSGTVVVWDALKVSFSLIIMDTCLRPIKF